MSISPQGPWGNCRGESRQELPETSRKIDHTQFHASGRCILLRTPLKRRKWSTLSSEVADSPAIFITFQAHRNTCTGCSESRPRPPECKTVQRCLQLPKARYPRLQGPIRPLIIHAQAAGNLTRQLSFMHPVHSVASTGHTGDPQDLTTRPLQEISRAYKKFIQEHSRYSKGPRTLIVSWSDGPIVTHYSRALQRQIHLQIHMQIQRHIASLRRIIQEHYRDRYTCRYRDRCRY